MYVVAGKRTTASASLVTLEQSILPGFIPPKPLGRLIKGKWLSAGACLLNCCAPGCGRNNVRIIYCGPKPKCSCRHCV